MTLDPQAKLDQLRFRRNPVGKHVQREVYASPMAEETHQAEIMEQLAERGPSFKPNRLHIGVAGLFNFEVAAVTRPDAMLLLDYNVDQEVFWQHVKENLITAPDASAFLRNLSGAMYEEYRGGGAEIIDPDHFVTYLREAQRSWFTEEAFQYFKKLAVDGKIMSATIDLVASESPAKELGRFIKREQFNVDTCYWSNIGQFFQPYVGKKVDGDGPVFQDGALIYPEAYYDSTPCDGPKKWDGDEHKKKFGDAMVRREPHDLPPFERFMRNISTIGGEHGLHILTSNRPDRIGRGIAATIVVVMPDGRREILDLQKGSGVSDAEMIPMMFEGPPRRTPEQWTQREQARKQHDAAVQEGKGVY